MAAERVEGSFSTSAAHGLNRGWECSALYSYFMEYINGIQDLAM